MQYNKSKHSFMHFFQTHAGRKVAFAGACTTTLGLFSIHFLPHTWGLRYYREFVQCYEHGMERSVPNVVRKRLEEALDKLDVKSYQRKIIRPFTVVGFDLFQAGSTKHRTGAELGIPANFAYSSTDDIDRNNIRFRNEKIDWNSSGGKLLQNSLVLSAEEQIFGLCKCILQLQTHYILLNSIFSSVSFLMIYSMGSFLNMRFNLFSRPLSLRITLYSLLSLFGFGCWSFAKDFSQVQYDVSIDKKLSNMGAPFVAAGVSFYDKQLQKNIALRALIGDDSYTATGNVNYLLRQKSLPLTFRKSFFEMKWKELQEATLQPESVLAQ